MALVITPVPGPSSRTGRPDFVSMTLAMRRAVMELVGNIAPTAFGPSIQPLKKRISSSNLAASFLPSCPAILHCSHCRYQTSLCRIGVFRQGDIKESVKKGSQTAPFSSLTYTFEKLLHPGEEACRFRTVLLGRELFKFLK